MDKIIELLPLLIPVILLQIGLATYALILLNQTKTVRGNSKLLWVLIIIFINLIGPILFLVIGRVEDAIRSEDQ